MAIHCPALLICAPSSGSGKTSITAAIARLHTRNGRRVRCFKTGPDFIDPTILEQASASPVYNLDPWIMGVDHCRELLFDAAQSADLILIEGVMGLFDGDPSSADLAQLFGLPLLAVIDGSAMAQTFGAIVHGLMNYRRDIKFAGVLANRIGSAYHADLLRSSLRELSTRSNFRFGWVPRSTDFALPERHLGLQIAEEIGDLHERMDKLADAIAMTEWAELPSPIEFLAAIDDVKIPATLQGVRIAVASDAAFCFLYRANLEWLQRMGAQIELFSPLVERAIPPADALYLPGGYPELHAKALAENLSMRDSIAAHIDANKPVLAECGGMLYLATTLVDLHGDKHALLGVLPATATMNHKLAALGSQQGVFGERTIRGHTFHYSTLQADIAPIAYAQTQSGGSGEAIYRRGCVVASYVHWYFPSNPRLIAQWFLGHFDCEE